MKLLAVGIGLMAFATIAGVSRPVFGALGIYGYGAFGVNMVLFWTGVVLTLIAAIRAIPRPGRKDLEK